MKGGGEGESYIWPINSPEKGLMKSFISTPSDTHPAIRRFNPDGKPHAGRRVSCQNARARVIWPPRNSSGGYACRLYVVVASIVEVRLSGIFPCRESWRPFCGANLAFNERKRLPVIPIRLASLAPANGEEKTNWE
jgi:hypothetical protein